MFCVALNGFVQHGTGIGRKPRDENEFIFTLEFQMEFWKKALCGLTAAVAMAFAGASANASFVEDFGTLADGTGLTTSNTNFTYLRTGTGGGGYVAENPSTLGTTGASMVLTGSSNSSLTGVGVETGLGQTSQTSMSFVIKVDDADGGDFFIGMGEGSMFTNNSVFVTSQLLFGIQSNNGVLQYRTTGWENVGFTLVDNTIYEFFITVDGSNLNININGTDYAFTDSANNQVGDAFRMYGINGSVNYEIDDIYIPGIPEPTSLILLGLGAAAMLGRRSRK